MPAVAGRDPSADEMGFGQEPPISKIAEETGPIWIDAWNSRCRSFHIQIPFWSVALKRSIVRGWQDMTGQSAILLDWSVCQAGTGYCRPVVRDKQMVVRITGVPISARSGPTRPTVGAKIARRSMSFGKSPLAVVRRCGLGQ